MLIAIHPVTRRLCNVSMHAGGMLASPQSAVCDRWNRLQACFRALADAAIGCGDLLSPDYMPALTKEGVQTLLRLLSEVSHVPDTNDW